MNRTATAALAAAGIVTLAACGSPAAQQHAQPAPTVTVTRTVPGPVKTKTVTRWKTRTITRTVYRDGYQYISQDPAWNCAGSLWNAYIRLAQGGPAGDYGLWQNLCPGVPEPAN